MVKGWNELVYMQDMNPTACSQAPLNTQKTLTDSRDGNTYTIARIKNQTNNEAKCWMTQNLRLVGDSTLTPEDSDVSEEYALPASTILDSTNDDPKQFSAQDIDQSKVYYNNSLVNGAYYNWYTATAGAQDVYSSIYGLVATSSICPKNWRLPNDDKGNNGDFYNLVNGLSYSNAIIAPYNFVFAGNVNQSFLNTTSGNLAGCWTANLLGYNQNINKAYYLRIIQGSNLASSYISMSDAVEAYIGLSVRCVAR